ncbi:hypothetical protein ABZY09_34185 [Streptomyces sp. NPDC002928]
MDQLGVIAALISGLGTLLAGIAAIVKAVKSRPVAGPGDDRPMPPQP